jgi:hypothetical protein
MSTISKPLTEWLRDSLRCGLLFGRADEPLDAYGNRIVRVILAEIESATSSHAEIQSPASGKAEPNQDDQARQSSSEKPLLDEIERLRDWNAALARQRDEAVEKGATDPARLTPLESGKAIGSANKQP